MTAQDAAPAESGAPGRTPLAAWYLLGVLLLVYVINFVDRQILSILVGDIKAHLGVSDAQIGFLYGTAFAVFYALFGIPLGRLADAWKRTWLMAIGLALWSTMTALSGLASTFLLLSLARIGVGIGEASASPAAYSMIADSFRKERRATALSIYSSGLYLGGAISLPLGGTIVAAWNAAYPDPASAPLGLVGWQAAFMAVGLPGLLLALWVLTLREPKREDAADAARPGAWADFGRELLAILPPLTLVSAARRPGGLVRNLILLAVTVGVGSALYALTGDGPQWLAYGLGVYAVGSWVDALRHRDPEAHAAIWGSPTVVVLAVSFGATAFISYAINFWMPPFAEAHFYGGGSAPSRLIAGMTAKQEVGMIIGWSAAVAAASGVIAGGYLSDRLYQRDRRGRLIVVAIAAATPLPVVWAMVTTSDLVLFYALSPVAQFFAAAWVGAAVAALQDLVPPRLRATAGATSILGTTMVGLALGPYAAGKVSVLTGSLATGILSVFAILPFILAGLWFAGRRIASMS